MLFTTSSDTSRAIVDEDVCRREDEQVSIDQVVRQIGRGRWLILLATTLMVVGATALTHVGKSPLYAARVRIEISGFTPRSATEASVLSSKAQAIATSRSVVDDAILAAGAQRLPTELAQRRIRVSSLGTSNVVRLTVTDRDPVVAAKLANSLAGLLIDNWDPETRERFRETLAELDARSEAIAGDIARIDADVAKLLATTGPVEPGREIPALTAALAVRADFAARAAAVEQQRSLLVSTETSYPPPRVLDSATAPTVPEASGEVQDLALATLVGLVLGIVVATTLETFWPRIHDPRLQAEALGAPYLGEFRRLGTVVHPEDLGGLVARMKDAARLNGVQLVSLVVVGDLARKVKLRTAIVDELRSYAKRVDLRLSPLHHAPQPEAAVKPLGERGRSTPNAIGLAVLSSNKVRRQDLEAVDQLRRTHGSTVIGVASIVPARRGFAGLSRVALVTVTDPPSQEPSNAQFKP